MSEHGGRCGSLRAQSHVSASILSPILDPKRPGERAAPRSFFCLSPRQLAEHVLHPRWGLSRGTNVAQRQRGRRRRSRFYSPASRSASPSRRPLVCPQVAALPSRLMPQGCQRRAASPGAAGTPVLPGTGSRVDACWGAFKLGGHTAEALPFHSEHSNKHRAHTAC